MRCQHLVSSACRGCPLCVEICPNDVLELDGARVRVAERRADECLGCGQCVAVCPHEALEVQGLVATSFTPIERGAVGFEALLASMRARRSARVFRDTPVPRSMLDAVAAAAAAAPMGIPPHTTELLVLDRREDLDMLFGAMVERYEGLVRAFGRPPARAIVRLVTGGELFSVLRRHVVPVARLANRLARERGEDRYTYRAPALLLFHADRRGISYHENAWIAATHAMLGAHALGLGTILLGMVPPIIERDRALKERLGIPRGHLVVAALAVGYAKYRFARGIRRELKAVRYFAAEGQAASTSTSGRG